MHFLQEGTHLYHAWYPGADTGGGGGDPGGQHPLFVKHVGPKC